MLILAPAVAEQTVEEGEEIGVAVNHAHDDADIRPGINITNYDRLHRFDCGGFAGVVLDESSIIKHHAAKTLQVLLETFRATRYKALRYGHRHRTIGRSLATMPSFSGAFPGRDVGRVFSSMTGRHADMAAQRATRGTCSGAG